MHFLPGFCRPIVVERICELFSLVPDLEGEDSEDQQVIGRLKSGVLSL